ncbi:MAG: hypothetical protein KGD70_07875 [Candidatus Lokiarchaeota archaeon]|nr:hypothetical protein [Candidatus Lokiarchaeota archaeon]
MSNDDKVRNESKIKERIWKIRDYIQDLNNIKEGIIHFLVSRKELDDVTKDLWISDVKGLYYNTVSAWEMLKSASKGNLNFLDKSKNFLHNARSLLAKVVSEIKFFKEELVLNLITETENSFENCWSAFYNEFNILTPEIKSTKHIERVIKVSDSEYHLPCSVCGKISVECKIGYGRFDEHESLVYSGITHSRSLRKNLANKLFKILKKEDLSEVHSFMKDYLCYEGIDAYCPECDKIYCWEHYNARVEYDDGFYDCTCGECPAGHLRMIDD